MPKWRLPKKQKEQRICEMLKQGASFREISKDQHVSFSYIAKIRKKYFEADDDEPENSKRSQALKLMEDGILDLNIAIELDLSSDEVKGFREEYMSLKRDDQLLELYRRIGGKIEPFLILYEKMKEEDLSPEQAVWILQDQGSFKNLEKEFTDLAKKVRPLREEVDQLQKYKEELIADHDRLSYQVDQLELGKQELTMEHQRLIHSLDELRERKLQLGSIVEGFVGVVDRFRQRDSQDDLEQSDGRLDIDWIGQTPRKIDDKLKQENESEKELSD